jgi:hypothetical protein
LQSISAPIEAVCRKTLQNVKPAFVENGPQKFHKNYVSDEIDRLAVSAYRSSFGAGDATIFSKHGSPRKGAHFGVNFK